MIHNKGKIERCAVKSEQNMGCPIPSNSSSDEGLHTPTTLVNLNVEDAQSSVLPSHKLVFLVIYMIKQF